MYRVLLVEDDQDLSEISRAQLSNAGYQVTAAFTSAQAEALLETDSFDLLLLDVMLPDRNGDELCRTIRGRCDCPIIFMSCLSDSPTIIGALRSGGDDYMVKPVNHGELLARAEAVIRRSGGHRETTVRAFHQFTVDTVRRRLMRDGKEVDLSSIEYALLEYMIQHPNTLLLYQDIYENVWKSDCLGDFRTVMVHISNLRKKLDPDHTGIIETVRGAGYIFADV